MNKPTEESLIKFFQGRSPKDEEEAIKAYLAMDVDKEYVETCMRKVFQDSVSPDREDTDKEMLDRVWLKMERKRTSLSRKIIRPRWYGYAAAIALFIISSALFFIQRSPTSVDDVKLVRVSPGSEKALLTLADGSVISLSEVPEGEIALQGGMRVEKTEEGNIVYRMEEPVATGDALNTISTPRGGQYHVTLPDGSKAWLNAASSLSYPIQFAKNERRVKMSGEVYFEIAKVAKDNKRIPFFVEMDKQEIEVLGTHFNVNAYADEPYVQTTLVEGSVRVTSALNGESVLLKPGQSAMLSAKLEIRDTDTDLHLAWLHDDFIFQGEELQRILRKVSRWYDIDIECPAHLSKLRFDGAVSRKKPLSTIIDMIQTTGKVNLKIKERRLIVTD